jgi:hypothetical protein
MDGSESTIIKIENLLRQTNLNAARLSVLCSLYGLKGLSDSSIARSTQLKKLSNSVDLQLRPLVLKIENLISRAEPFPISFVDPEHIKTLLDAVDLGVNLSTNTIPLYKNNSIDSSTTIPAAQ